MIPKYSGPVHPQQSIPPNNTRTQSPSRLAKTVNAFTSKRLWRLRTLLVIVCAVSVVFLETTKGVYLSGLVVLFPMDCVLLLYTVLAHRPSPSDTGGGNPLGKLSLLKMPLMVLYPATAEWFESVCLSVLLVGLLLCDILFMIFSVILFKCILSVLLMS